MNERTQFQLLVLLLAILAVLFVAHCTALSRGTSDPCEIFRAVCENISSLFAHATGHQAAASPAAADSFFYATI